DLHGGGIEHLDAVHRVVEAAHAGLGGRIHQAVDAELHGGGVHRGAVVEEDVLPQLERVEEAVGRGVPRLGGVANELAVGRYVDETAPDVHGHPHHFVARGRVEIEVSDLVAVRDAQRAATLGRLGPGEQRRGDDTGDHDQDERRETR